MLISETSPLLSQPLATSFPSISEAVTRLGDDRVSIADICPGDTGDVCGETAFYLVVLLQSRAQKLKPKLPSDVWNQWAETAVNESYIQRLNDRIINAWVLFLDEYRTTAEIEQVLWTSFLINDGSARRVRVVDLLTADSPSELLGHDVVMLSLANMWKNGPSLDMAPQENSPSRIALRYDAICSPRVLHFMDLAGYLSYFGLLVSYVMRPPFEPTIFQSRFEYVGAREILLMVFSSSILLRPWTIFNLPFAITLLMFLISLPAVPFEGSVSFIILLACFIFHAFQFHFPRSPSPLFVLKVQHSLPFACFLTHGFYRVILPLTVFFLPIFVLGTCWLSMALAKTFFVPFALFDTLVPTPMETRTTVLFIFFSLLVAVCCSLFIFAVLGRTLDPAASGWDSYSSAVGRTARASFVRAVISYSSPYTFPAPLSLLHAIFIWGPSTILPRLRIRLPFAQAEKLLWRITVGPIGLIAASVLYFLP
ncbi:hypothetical protein C8F04DRAFT_117985 [Mycena alexandri]|uniref:Uncharacterized protein n=1 Tax=Mycena alexandri TaxID=1745969 RepID=A0AAD6SEX8_9AGAR|nr:hypothetical protein C8F04DRAFT_117985 [Mycena alexandri]